MSPKTAIPADQYSAAIVSTPIMGWTARRDCEGNTVVLYPILLDESNPEYQETGCKLGDFLGILPPTGVQHQLRLQLRLNGRPILIMRAGEEVEVDWPLRVETVDGASARFSVNPETLIDPKNSEEFGWYFNDLAMYEEGE